MLTLFQGKSRKAFTLLEIMIAMTVLATLGALISHWFTLNTKHQRRLTQQSDSDNKLRKIVWTMHQDIKTSRTILYPRCENITNNIKSRVISDSKLVIRNFDGDLISYHFDQEKKELSRELIYLPTGYHPSNEVKVIGKDLSTVVFTNRNELNNLVGIYIEDENSVLLDSVYMMNE